MEQIVWTLALGGFAGFVRYIQRFAGTVAERPPWEWTAAGICIGTGAFVSLLTLWLIEKSIEGNHVYFAIAIAGYGGPATLDFFQQLFRDAVSRAAQKPPNDGPKG